MSAASALPGSALPQGAAASLGRLAPTFEIDRFGTSFGLGPTRGSGVLTFHFCFQEVPFTARTERRDGRPVLCITGDLGHLPYSIENATRRRRLRKVLASARHLSGLSWEITPQNLIQASGEIELGLPLTPAAVIAGATTLLLRSQPYLELIVAVASES
jgi:hypothetical protein